MEKIQDFTKYVVPHTREYFAPDSHGGAEYQGQVFTSTDNVYIARSDEYDNLPKGYKTRLATDFSLALGINSIEFSEGMTGGFYVNPEKGSYGLGAFSPTGNYNGRYSGSLDEGLCPCLSLGLNGKKLTVRKIKSAFGEITTKQLTDRTNVHTINIGEWPQTKAPQYVINTLETLYNYGNPTGGLNCTGKLFSISSSYNGSEVSPKYYPEFEYNGERYIRMRVDAYAPFSYADHVFNEGRSDVIWVKVEPISFIIKNYSQIKSRKATTIELESEKIIISKIPFYPGFDWDFRNQMWENSLVRAYLNGVDSSKIDKNLEIAISRGWDFSCNGFLQQAMDLTTQPTRELVIPSYVTTLDSSAIEGCVGVKKIVIPQNVKNINGGAISHMDNTQIEFLLPDNISFNINSIQIDIKYVYLSKDGENVILSPYKDEELSKTHVEEEIKLNDFQGYFQYDKYFNANYRKNYVKFSLLKGSGKVKFIPPHYTLHLFPASEMDKFLVNKNHLRWGKLVKTLRFDQLNGTMKINALTDLLKIYYALGGFSENQGESQKAYNYVLEHIGLNGTGREAYAVGEIAGEIHRRFSRIELKGPYNPQFAQFFMKYYHENPNFMEFDFQDENGYSIGKMDYLCQAHNSFNAILKNYPNRVVNGNEIRSLLTPEFVAKHCYEVEYYDVDEGNESLAGLVGKYGYSQSQFEHIQEVYNKAKGQKNDYVIRADKSKEHGGITFRVLEKDDPLGFVLGDITNCCQHIGGAAESCVDDGYLNQNSGFLVFEETILDENGNPTDEKRILGQAYVWYDPETKTVCYDNIEIPTKVLDELEKGQKRGSKISTEKLLDVVVESADAIMEGMNSRGIEVKHVTTGVGYNDLASSLKERFGEPEQFPEAKNRNYNIYSDARGAQFLIRTYDETTKFYTQKIQEMLVGAQADLMEIKEMSISGEERDVWWQKLKNSLQMQI